MFMYNHIISRDSSWDARDCTESKKWTFSKEKRRSAFKRPVSPVKFGCEYVAPIRHSDKVNPRESAVKYLPH